MPVTDRVGVIVLLCLTAGSAGVDSVALFILCRSNCLALYPAVTLCRDSFSVPVSASTSVNSLALEVYRPWAVSSTLDTLLIQDSDFDTEKGLDNFLLTTVACFIIATCLSFP